MVIQRNEYQAHAGPELQFFSSPNCAILAVSTWSVLPQDIPVDLLIYKPEIPVQEICLALQNRKNLYSYPRCIPTQNKHSLNAI
jgi:hypothetical protein